VVKGGTFGRLFDTKVNGSVYGQPLLDDGQLLVNTENNDAYSLNPATGAVLWIRRFRFPVSAGDVGCPDLAPNMGITSTAVVDQATHTEYLVSNEYLSGDSGAQGYFMHALNLDQNGAEEPGFPVEIHGTAANNPQQTFNPKYEVQRPGLLLLGGVVYAAFAAHCDVLPFQGWIAGVSEAGKLTTMWTSEGKGKVSGAGIWQSGGGIVSDGPGTMLIATGNGDGPGATPGGTIPGHSPPANLGQSVVRLNVQPNGSLKAVDFFAPQNAPALDVNDLDFGSGAAVGLPQPYFGTPAVPHLSIAVGKEGYVYLLNRDNLGGEGEGPGGTDKVVQRLGPNGGVWSSPGVWPGDGGWVYIPTASTTPSQDATTGFMEAYKYGTSGSGLPQLTLKGRSSDSFGFGSSAPVVTSDGTKSGSALMWTIWSPSGSGVGAQLRAYEPVPVNGVLKQVFAAPIGTASKFNPPGVANNRIYVGTRDGHVLGFGVPTPGCGAQPSSPSGSGSVVGMTTTLDGKGYAIASTDGGVRVFGDAPYCGSMAGKPLNQPIEHIVRTADGEGYWLVAADGGTFAFGDAPFYGSMGGQPLNAPIVDIAPTPDGQGYWLVASDGGVFSFGDAAFFGSTGAIHLNEPVVGMAATPDGQGYWLVASDGGIFAFGDAAFFGSTGAIHLNEPVVGMAAAPGGQGYWMVASDGGIFAFGDAGFFGSTGAIHLNAPMVGMAATPDGNGYWLVASDGGIFNAGDANFYGSGAP
jgi:hypothetical protein